MPANSQWVSRSAEDRAEKSPAAPPRTPGHTAMRGLKKRLQRAEMGRDILKKATVLLMSDSLNNSPSLRNSVRGVLLPLCATCPGFITAVIKTGGRPGSLTPQAWHYGALCEVYRESNGSAGVRSIAAMVTTRGITLSCWRATKRMESAQYYQLSATCYGYKKASEEHTESPDYLDGQFAVTGPAQVWCDDVTNIWTGKRRVFLAIVLNLFSSRPADCLTRSREAAIPAGISASYCEIMNKATPESPGNCRDNSPIEPFFRSLKTE